MGAQLVLIEWNDVPPKEQGAHKHAANVEKIARVQLICVCSLLNVFCVCNLLITIYVCSLHVCAVCSILLSSFSQVCSLYMPVNSVNYVAKIKPTFHIVHSQKRCCWLLKYIA